MGSVLGVKIGLMVAFFLEVTIFGNFISGLSCFKNKRIMDLAMTFSGTLFLSIAMIDVIPQAIANFDEYFSSQSARFQSSSLHQGKLPLTMIIAVITMLIIMYLDKLLIGHSHDHEYEISFVAGPKKNEDGRSVDLKEIQKKGGSEIVADDQNQNNEHHIQIHSEGQKLEEENLTEGSSSAINWRPFILQVGMSIHAFFQTLAVGLQKNTISVLSLASAILVHKWAEGLTLGLMYKKEGYSGKTALIMVMIQGSINILGLMVGNMLMGQGSFIMAFFMSMSVGTFFYISLGEVLQQQLQNFDKKKLLMVLLANSFVAFVVWFEKQKEANAQSAAL